MIVDSHLHPIAANEERYKLKPGPKAAWLRSMPAERIRADLDAAGIDRAILVQAFGAYGFDNAYAVDCAAAWPDRFSSVCTVDPCAADAPELLSYWVSQRGAAGLRLHGRTGVALDDPRVAALLQRATALSVPVCVLSDYAAIAQLDALLARFPSVPIVLDHMGFPPLEEGPPYAVSRALLDLARFPNLLLKFSPVNLEAAARGGGDFLPLVVDRFGAERLMWGSNAPASAERTLREQLDLARQCLSFLKAADRRLILGETAARIWATASPSPRAIINDRHEASDENH